LGRLSTALRARRVASSAATLGASGIRGQW
jgi:hypothetical protein